MTAREAASGEKRQKKFGEQFRWDFLRIGASTVLVVLLVSGIGIFAREVAPQYVDPVLESFHQTLADAERVVTETSEVVVDTGKEVGGTLADAGRAVGRATTSAGKSFGGALVYAGRAAGGTIADAGRAAGETVVGIGRGAGEVVARISLPKISFPSIFPTVTPTFAIQNPVVTALTGIQKLMGEVGDLASRVGDLASRVVTKTFEAASAVITNLNVTGTLIFTGRLGSSLIPASDNSFDLGSSSLRFRGLYLGTLTTTTLTGDLTCTACISATEVEDIYLFNTGDTATGDYNFDVGTLFIDSTNNRVGIGTTTPGYKLEVSGTGYFSGALSLGTEATTTAHAIRADRSLTFTQDTNVTISNSGVAQNLTADRSWTLGWTGQLAPSRGGTGDDTSATTGVPYISSGDWLYEAQLATSRGGTGQDWSTVAQGNIPYFSAAGTMATLAPSTSGYFLKTQGTGANPTWAAVATTYARAVTKTVCASNALDTTNCDYLADGTNDEVEINNAISALPSGGGVVALLDGTYTVNPQTLISGSTYYAIGLNSNVSLVGAGANTVIKLKNSWGSNTGYIIYASSKDRILLQNFRIDGNRANQSTGNLYGIYFTGTTNSKINNLWVEGVRTGGVFLVSNSNNNIITGNKVYYTQGWNGEGIYISSSQSNIISGNDVSGNNFGIVLSFSEYNTIVSNYTSGNNNNCIALSSSNKNTISGNTVSVNGREGISLSSSHNNTISGNNLNNNVTNSTTGSSIGISSSNYNTITGNVIYEITANNPGDGIYVTGNNNNISSNVIYDSSSVSGCGINISSGSNNYLIGNEISGAGFTAKINDAGTGTTIQQRDWFEIESARTSGTLLSLAIPSATTLTGALTGTSINLSTNLTATGQSVTGQTISLPAVTNTGAGTYNYGGLTVSGGALIQNTAAGINDWRGLDITMPNITQTLGTVTSTGLRITGGTVTSGTSYGLIIDSAAGNVGIGTTTPGTKLHVVGGITSPGSGSQSEQFGLGASASGNQATAVGYNASASASNNSTALGSSASASASQAIALGASSSASNNQAIAIGSFTNVAGLSSMGFGYDADIVGGADYSATFGYGAQVGSSAHDYAFVFGRGTTSGGANQFIIGNATYPMGVGIGTNTPTAGYGLTIAPPARTSGNPSLLTITGPADTSLAASTEATDVNLNLARTVQFTTGDITTQRAVRIQAPTYSFVGASTITNAATLSISGAPIAGTNATITNPAALIVESGNVGIGTTAPSVALELGPDKSLRISGGTSFPGSPSEGQMFFRTDNKQLYTYANAKWQADRTTATKIVATTNTSNPTQNSEKADYVCGNSDCDTTIETAISALPTGGGVVVFLEGTYVIDSDGIDITKSNVSLIGTGKATILQRGWDTATNDGVITVGDGGTTTVTGGVIANLSINGCKAVTAECPTAYTGTENIGIYFNQKVSQSRIQNTWIYGCDGWGIYFNQSTVTYNLIKGNDLRDNGSAAQRGGIQLYGANYNTISGNVLYNNHNTGIWLYPSNNNIISENYIYSTQNGFSGINFTSNANYNTISGNSIYASGDTSSNITIGPGSYNTIIGNNLSGAYRDLYIGSGSNYNVVSGNSLDSGIIVYSNNNIISGNKVGGGFEGGITIQSGASNNYIIGNENAGTISDAGTGTTIQQRDQFEIESARTSGTLLSLAIPSATTLAGALTGTSLNLLTNLTATGQSVTGQTISLPAITNTGAGTYNYRGLTVSGGALVQNTAAGINDWRGLDITMPNITQTLGTVTSTGIRITGGTVTSGTSYGLIIDAAAGNVGIGTTIPASKLEVVGAIRVADGSQSAPTYTFSSDPTYGMYRTSGSIGFIAGGSSWDLWIEDTRILATPPFQSFYGGSASSPGFSFNDDSDMGMYRIGTDILGFSTAGTERIRIDSTGNVGIGDASPDGKLDVEATGVVTTSTYGINLSNLVTNTTTDAINKYGAYITSTGTFTGGAGTATNNWGLYVDTVSGADNNYGAYIAGNVGIGRTPTTNKLEVEGDASKTTAGDWLANSDIRIKTDIQDLESALDVINQLHPVMFRYTDEYMAAHPSIKDRYYYNFIAQEFQEVFPDAVKEDGEGYLQLDAYVVRPYLVAAVQELSRKVRDLEAALDSSGNLACGQDPCRLTKLEAKEGIFEKITATILGTFEKIAAKTAEIAEAVIQTLRVEKLTVENLVVEGPTIGEAKIPAGETKILITNSLITDHSKVFVTVTEGTRPLKICGKEPEKSFTVCTIDEEPTETPVKFDYWIIN